MSLVGDTIGNYQLIKKIGEGGMGTVYMARHPIIARQVAIKVMSRLVAHDDGMAARFFGEARAVNEIRHPNILEIFDCGREGERLYFTMELLEGSSLARRISGRPLPMSEVVHIGLQVADALGASHRQGIVHRDLKPENIFLVARPDDDRFVKVLDFGLAKLPTQMKQYSSATGIREVFGTPAYMSPEQCESAGLSDARSDIYALGIVLYEMVTGRLPFERDSNQQILLAQMLDEPVAPSKLNPDVPPALEKVVLKALKKKAGARFQNMDELAAALRATGTKSYSGSGGSTDVDLEPPSGKITNRRRSSILSLRGPLPRVAAAAALVVLLLLAANVWRWRRRNSAPTAISTTTTTTTPAAFKVTPLVVTALTSPAPTVAVAAPPSTVTAQVATPDSKSHRAKPRPSARAAPSTAATAKASKPYSDDARLKVPPGLFDEPAGKRKTSK